MRTANQRPASPRLSRVERRRQLLDTALEIVRAEGADRLTLGRLAERAGISKPVAYDHFGTRSGLLIEMYTSIDHEQSDALRGALTTLGRSLEDTCAVFAAAYIRCSTNASSEWHAVGAALTGSKEMDTVHQQLLDGYVQLLFFVLKPLSSVAPGDLERICVGLIGAGEALLAAMARGTCDEEEATVAFTSLIQGGLRASPY